MSEVCTTKKSFHGMTYKIFNQTIGKARFEVFDYDENNIPELIHEENGFDSLSDAEIAAQEYILGYEIPDSIYYNNF